LLTASSPVAAAGEVVAPTGEELEDGLGFVSVVSIAIALSGATSILRLVAAALLLDGAMEELVAAAELCGGEIAALTGAAGGVAALGGATSTERCSCTM
jgi:hypothetical protein